MSVAVSLCHSERLIVSLLMRWRVSLIVGMCRSRCVGVSVSMYQFVIVNFNVSMSLLVFMFVLVCAVSVCQRLSASVSFSVIL